MTWVCRVGWEGVSEDRRRIGESRFSDEREITRLRLSGPSFSARQGCDGQPPPTPKSRITHSRPHVHHSILVTLISSGWPPERRSHHCPRATRRRANQYAPNSPTSTATATSTVEAVEKRYG